MSSNSLRPRSREQHLVGDDPGTSGCGPGGQHHRFGPSANPDANFNYTVSVTNNGPSDATDVVLRRHIARGRDLRFAPRRTQGWLRPISNGAVSLAIDSLNVGDTVTMTIVVTPTAPPGSTLVDSASVVGRPNRSRHGQ